MQFHILTLFPEMVENGLQTSILGRAIQKGLIGIHAVNIRDYTKDKHNKVDDYPYGGGAGMVMQPEPVYKAYEHVRKDMQGSVRVLYMTPQGRRFDHEMSRELACEDNLIFLCGHYEGVDQRVLDLDFDCEISVGDYVLTGGELPAMTLADAVARYVPGVLGSGESTAEESFSSGLLEYPQYTRPQIFEGLEVPEVLVSGHHANVAKWRMERQLEITRRCRPDLLKED